jgi:hypothetical protein
MPHDQQTFTSTSSLLGTIASLTLALGWAASAGASQGSSSEAQTKSAAIVGSEVRNTGESWCDDGKEQVQKVLVLKTETEDGDAEEIETRRWVEATGESCEGESALPELPAASELADLGQTLEADATGREETTRGPWCSGSCVFTRGRYECWGGSRYWVEYCYNECSEHTGQHYWWFNGRCW